MSGQATSNDIRDISIPLSNQPAAAAAAAALGLVLSKKSLQFQHPFSISISGPIGSGKIQFFSQIFLNGTKLIQS